MSWAGGPTGRRQRPCVTCPLSPTQHGQPPQHKGRSVRLGRPASGGGAEGTAPGSGVVVVRKQVSPTGPSGAPRSQSKPGLPPMSVRQQRGGFGDNSGPPSYQMRGWFCTGLFMGDGRRQGRVLSPSSAAHTLTSSSSSASANAKVCVCTVLGTGALLAAWGASHSSSRLSQEARPWGSTFTSSRRASISV